MAIDLKTTEFHKRLPRCEFIDAIRVTTVPRWKTSGLSGDEWRASALVEFFHKGLKVHEYVRGNARCAVSHMQYEMDCFADGAVLTEEGLAHEGTRCDNIGCSAAATKKRYLLREYSPQGEALDPAESRFKHWRKFCDDHVRRGDCSREDSDDNYTEPEPFVARARGERRDG